MNATAENFGHLYHPVKALLVYKRSGKEKDFYIESFDVDAAGKPVNGHPLSVKESSALAKALQVKETRAQSFLTPDGLLPKNVLHINSSAEGWVMWHTPAQQRELLFTPSLGIPSGRAQVPALLWKAGKHHLQVFALNGAAPALKDTLFKAPFFNIYADGRVCMGNVRISIPRDCGLEDFMSLWERHFYNSYFSHTIHGESPVKGNIIQLWQHLTKTGEQFPDQKLKATQLQIKHLIQ